MVDIRHTWDKSLRKMVTIRTTRHAEKEYAVMKSFDIPQIVKPIELREDLLVLPYHPEREADGAAGYCTERLAWKFLRDIAAALMHIHGKGYVHNGIRLSGISIGKECFVLSDFGACVPAKECAGDAADDIWALGAAVFHLLMGVELWGGKGMEIQKPDTVIPTLRRDLYSSGLSDMIAACLSYDRKGRPTAEDVARKAAMMMPERNAKTVRKTYRPEGNIPYEDIWPEAMTD